MPCDLAGGPCRGWVSLVSGDTWTLPEAGRLGEHSMALALPGVIKRGWGEGLDIHCESGSVMEDLGRPMWLRSENG